MIIITNLKKNCEIPKTTIEKNQSTSFDLFIQERIGRMLVFFAHECISHTRVQLKVKYITVIQTVTQWLLRILHPKHSQLQNFINTD